MAAVFAVSPAAGDTGPDAASQLSTLSSAAFDLSPAVPAEGSAVPEGEGPADAGSIAAGATGSDLCTDVATDAPCDSEDLSTAPSVPDLTAAPSGPDATGTTAAAKTPGTIRCTQGFIKSVFEWFGGYGVVYGAKLHCSFPIGLGAQARLETPNHSEEATSEFKDCVGCKNLSTGGGYYEDNRKSHRIFTSYAYLAPPNYKWIKPDTPHQASGCAGYGTNFLLCARYSKVFR